MSETKRELLEILRYELNVIEQGGYRRARKADPKASPFRSNLCCLNYNVPHRPHACHECQLYQLVPEEKRIEDVPCHHIPLDGSGRTINTFLAGKNRRGLERSLMKWIRATIARFENEGSVQRAKVGGA